MRARTVLICLALVTASVAAGLTPASAQDGGPTVGPRIIGGGQADPGEYPFQAALLQRGLSRTAAFRCGGTVLSRNWILTAAHCMIDGQELYPDSRYGIFVPPSHYEVLTGTNDLLSGGEVDRVAAIYVHPDYDPTYSRYDVALMRLATPTAAPEVAVIGTSAAEQALDDAGLTATVTGWGLTSNSGSSIPSKLREVQVPIISSASCSSSYPIGIPLPDGNLYEYYATDMVCAGVPEGGKDSCQGDSGGPLLTKASDGSWREVGVVSFGYECALAGYPGVYHRLTSTSSWIGRTRRFGPFNADGRAYIAQQYRDFAGRTPTSQETNWWLSVLASEPASTIIVELQASAGWDANAGMNTRLYRAAFLRNPDTSGLDYWVRQRWAGRGPVSIANHFTASSEFASRYGSLTNDAFISLIYQNVFERAPDPGGRSYWNRKLASGVGRGQMLYELSNSSEYRRDTDTLVRIVTTRFGLLRRAPTAGEITSSEALSQRSLVDTLRTSLRYAQRFSG